ncbi:putative GPH family arabinoside transporter [Buttiauxella ferragutiae ATCC 51602]|jgi:sugar (glycoside-pentoside-hexuronide) transporter|uniref:GPH family arabinoside transporter n=1 Tax=Buttiauxella ferragutiae ATCC 51602 TaxID=1354252 RepID=A0ABX2WDX0_9ENTR|nr:MULTISPECIES: MFS transporter [Buttiauxella]MCE0826474.1 MFS transporter [Buttiauxella ferragutiae]OAT33344.1 putative GPH family arabinoside transporter [Buttiauxella ferragutiae ATCC 51602]TDN50698.1 sugar (glycoside-pentoside-hexuronide) transporter [Buttiauxella sp. JUb87]UNK60629.1 MFS transporter [Buttiauxella ferragutiae]
MESSKLSIKEKIGYGMGDAGCNIIFGAIMLFVNYFYTDIFGLAPALVGVMLLSIRVIDAVTDPIMGAIADRTQSRWGRFRPWILWMAAPFAFFSYLMFTTPDWAYSSKVIYAFVTYFLLSLTYTAINIPYCSLGSVITNDPKERVACQAYRFVMVGIATLILSLSLLPMVDWFGGGDKAKGYQMAMGVLAVLGMCMFLFCFTTVRERVRPAVPSNDDLKADLKDVWKNDQWVRILLLTLCNVCPGFIRMAATMYYVTWVMGQSTSFATLFISLGVVGMMGGSMLAKVLTDRICKLKVFFWTNIVLAIFSCGFYFLDPHATTLIVVMYFLLNILHQIPSPLHWSLMADVDDYGEWKTGKRITGISFSGNLFFLKLGLAIAGAMVGFLLSWYGYDAGAKQQSADSINGIVMLFTIIPGVGYLITAGVVRLLKVDRELMQRIQADLEKRRINYRELNEYHDSKPVEAKL